MAHMQPDEITRCFDEQAPREQGIAVTSCPTLPGRYCLRIAIANHRSRQEDFDLLAREVVRIGRGRVPQFS